MNADGQPTVALVSREFWPFFTGGGIARYMRATATLLAGSADVTVILPDFYAGSVPLDDPRVPRGVRFEFVPEPDRSDPRPFSSSTTRGAQRPTTRSAGSTRTEARTSWSSTTTPARAPSRSRPS